MAPVNGYCTVDQLKALIASQTAPTNALDDGVMDDLITDASRLIDAVCGGRTFYKRAAATRYYTLPPDRQLDLDDDLLVLTTLTNGDGTVIAGTEYLLLPRNEPPHYAVRLKSGSLVFWESDAEGNTEQIIAVLGDWGYVDRAASDARSAGVIANTRRAALEIALMKYHQRTGQNIGGNTILSPAGIVQTPAGAIPKSAWDVIQHYVRRV